MLPNSCLPAVMDVYPQQPEYVQQPTGEDQLNGVKPLDTLPAQWWNWLWKNITTNEAKTAVFMTNLSNEFVNLLAAAGLTPDNTDVQLRNAVRGMIETVATTAALGTVKSSTASGKVSVDNEGVMTPNGLGTPSSLQTTATDVVSAINEVHNAIGDLDTLSTSQKTDIVAALNSFISLGGTANGYATLDSSGRLPASQLPESSLEYQGTWDASTNTPTLADGTGTKGDFYIVSVGGLWNSIAFSAGDRILYDGSTWQRLSGGDVQTVNSKSPDGSGNILLRGCDIQLGLGTCSTKTLACALVCNSAGTLLGNLTSLCTTCKDTLVNAINKVYECNQCSNNSGHLIISNADRPTCIWWDLLTDSALFTCCRFGEYVCGSLEGIARVFCSSLYYSLAGEYTSVLTGQIIGWPSKDHHIAGLYINNYNGISIFPAPSYNAYDTCPALTAGNIACWPAYWFCLNCMNGANGLCGNGGFSIGTLHYSAGCCNSAIYFKKAFGFQYQTCNVQDDCDNWKEVMSHLGGAIASKLAICHLSFGYGYCLLVPVSGYITCRDNHRTVCRLSCLCVDFALDASYCCICWALLSMKTCNDCNLPVLTWCRSSAGNTYTLCCCDLYTSGAIIIEFIMNQR